MSAYFGIITIGKIDNCKTDTAADDNFLPIDPGHVKFVHYPDCQQLITWLSHPGREYGNIQLIDNIKGVVVEEFPVADKLSGSIQVLWDTLPIAPGSYTVAINWNHGWQHTIDLIKHKEGEEPNEKIIPHPVKKIEENPADPVEYRDGFGKTIPNEDIQLRNKLLKELTNKFSRTISYEGNFRSGKIIYTDAETRIEFYHEMGGGNCMFIIDVPEEKYWEAQTKTPLGSRKEILEYIAIRVQVEQAPRCRYEIKENTITYYYR